MKKKATLIIMNIRKLYTMKQKRDHSFLNFQHAFIAVHHNKIIALGEGSYAAYSDKDTRIINACDQIVIPGLIDVAAGLYPLLPYYARENEETCSSYLETEEEGTKLRHVHEYLFLLMKHGVTSIGIQHSNSHLKKAAEVLKCDHRFELINAKAEIPVLRPQNIVACEQIPDQFCISCGYHPVAFPCLDPFFAMRVLSLRYAIPMEQAVASMTCHAAKAVDASHIGILEVGKQADLLILRSPSLEDIGVNISYSPIMSVIKRGVQIYPNPIIS